MRKVNVDAKGGNLNLLRDKLLLLVVGKRIEWPVVLICLYLPEQVWIEAFMWSYMVSLIFSAICYAVYHLLCSYNILKWTYMLQKPFFSMYVMTMLKKAKINCLKLLPAATKVAFLTKCLKNVIFVLSFPTTVAPN